MEQTKDIFGKRLLHLRENRGESQQELADSIGITRQSLSRYELGERTANIDLLKKIAQHYNISADYLLGLTENDTTDINLKAVCEYTGLLQNSIQNILYFAERCKSIYGNNKEELQISQQTLDDILTTRCFWGIIEDLAFLSILKERGFNYEQEKKEAKDQAKSLKAAFEREIGYSVDTPINTIDGFLCIKYNIINNFEELIKIFLPEKERVNINGEYYSQKE